MLPVPKHSVDKIKFHAWRHVISPAFPHVRDFLLALKIIRHEGRQLWPLGWLASGRTIEDFVKFLETAGFHNHFVAWVDSGQLFSLRRADGFEYQYHLRIFKDGEVRGHYEKTPESNPIQHFRETVFEPREAEFMGWIGDWVTPHAPKADQKIKTN